MSKPNKHRGDDTFVSDIINAALPIEEQFPPELEDGVLPGPLEAGYRVVRCPRREYETVKQAQAFFESLRARDKWTHQTPIFRTARYWVRRVFP